MKTKFTEMMDWFNTIINKSEYGSDRYKQLVLEKYKFIHTFVIHD